MVVTNRRVEERRRASSSSCRRWSPRWSAKATQRKASADSRSVARTPWMSVWSLVVIVSTSTAGNLAERRRAWHPGGMAAGKRWTREQLLLALHLYERIPFGQQDQRNAEVIELSQKLGRTPSSVAMKLNNFTSIDPAERGRVKGLPGASDLDREVWAEFHQRPAVVEEAERLWGEQKPQEREPLVSERLWEGKTEAEVLGRARLAQSYFRRVVLANFGGRCALTGIAHKSLLTASHIVAWAEAPEHRVKPGNGLCLNRLHDAAFDSRLISFDDDLRLLVGRRLRKAMPREPLAEGFLSYEGQALRAPERHEISNEFLRRHRAGFERLNSA